MKEKIKKKVDKIIKRIISSPTAADIKTEAELINDIGLDSLDLTELFLSIEDVFDISIPEEKAKDLRTLGDVYNYVAVNC